MTDIRVALAGVGSCASSLIQVAEMARHATGPMNGVMFERIGGYRIGDMRFVLAFDVDRNKIGVDLSKAMATLPTAATIYSNDEPYDTLVEAGPLYDGIGGNLTGLIEPHPDCTEVSADHVAQRLSDSSADVLVCVLPTGATQAVQAYARAAAKGRVAFVNATPEQVVHEPELAQLFGEQGVPLLGDDLRSHLGATTLHVALIELLRSRGLEINSTYQLNVGGNTDFLNLADPSRASSKVRSKRNALQAAGIDAHNVSAGPNGFVEFLGDTKTCFIRIDATSVLDSPCRIDIKMEVEDSPNAAGVLVNAVRLAAAARDRGQSGVIDPVCPFLFKNPRHGATESDGLRMLEAYIKSVAAGEDEASPWTSDVSS
jgi:myo-inositol-1-phosphate synthase